MENNIPGNITPTSQAAAGDKAPYAKPVLRVFGGVKQLTKGGGGSRIDGNGPSKDQNGF